MNTIKKIGFSKLPVDHFVKDGDVLKSWRFAGTGFEKPVAWTPFGDLLSFFGDKEKIKVAIPFEELSITRIVEGNGRTNAETVAGFFLGCGLWVYNVGHSKFP